MFVFRKRRAARAARMWAARICIAYLGCSCIRNLCCLFMISSFMTWIGPIAMIPAHWPEVAYNERTSHASGLYQMNGVLRSRLDVPTLQRRTCANSMTATFVMESRTKQTERNRQDATLLKIQSAVPWTRNWYDSQDNNRFQFSTLAQRCRRPLFMGKKDKGPSIDGDDNGEFSQKNKHDDDPTNMDSPVGYDFDSDLSDVDRTEVYCSKDETDLDDSDFMFICDDDDDAQEFDQLQYDLLELEQSLKDLGRMNDGDDRVLFPKSGVDGDHGIDDSTLMEFLTAKTPPIPFPPTTSDTKPIEPSGDSPLEKALLQGVVPADAGVGSKALPGDYGFDPLSLSTKDYFHRTQNFFLDLLPERDDIYHDHHTNNTKQKFQTEQTPRPPALILRDYREAEIRHGRLAMLAAVLWPIQEIFDRIFIPDKFGSMTVVYGGGVTLPYASLLMTLMMLLLGYLDIYAAAVKDADAGDAFLPGECFWDPLKLLDGAPDYMKRNMQERELFNGRAAMVAVAFFILQEAIFHQPVISLPWNVGLFEPAYTVPVIQAWLDERFQAPSPTFTFPGVGDVDFVETMKEIVEEEEIMEEAIKQGALLDGGL